MKKKQEVEVKTKNKKSSKSKASTENTQKSGLSFQEKMQLRNLKKALNGKDKETKVPDTAQKTITFEKMYQDGICKVSANHYTKMVEFYDINYDLLEIEDQGVILEDYSKLINYFDPSIKFQLFLFNRQQVDDGGGDCFALELLQPFC